MSTQNIYLLMEKLLSKHFLSRKISRDIGELKVKEPMISNDVTTEWKTFRQFMAKQPKESMQLQLKELVTNETLVAMFPNLNTLANISLSIPVSTASVERSFRR